LQATFDNAVKKKLKQTGERVANERFNIHLMKNKEISASVSQARRALTDLREGLTENLFNDVRNDLAAFTASTEYKEYLSRNIKACPLGNFSCVQVMARDKSIFMAIKDSGVDMAFSGLLLETADDDFIGGFKLFTADRKIIADYTLLSSLQEQRRLFPALYAESLRGEKICRE
jgi:vacuolar-type H+-ATPase subunit E/Vma4